MDPNANLKEQEEILQGFLDRDAMDRLDELREALTQWIVQGGFEPDWATCPDASLYYGR